MAEQSQKQPQQSSVSSDVSTFSFSSSACSGDSDGRSCSSGSCSAGIQPQNANQRNSIEQNGNDAHLQAVQQQQIEQQAQQKPKKLLVRDEAYWERRRKNNDAAKRSRDSRRKKVVRLSSLLNLPLFRPNSALSQEDEVAVRAVVLEQENLQLRFEVERLRFSILIFKFTKHFELFFVLTQVKTWVGLCFSLISFHFCNLPQKAF